MDELDATGFEAEQRLADWMARAMVAEAAVAELMEDRARQRPWLFVPGDKVIVLYGNKMEGGTVTRVQMPGPIREDSTVFVEMDDVATGQLHQSMWFDPDQVERIVP